MLDEKRICLVLPAYNEEETIGDVIDAIPHFVDYIIVVDDGSNDGTGRIAEEKGAKVIKHVRNMGVGAAFNTGINAALEVDCDIVVNMDADGQFNPSDIEKLVKPIVRGEAQVVTASRFMDPGMRPEGMSRIKYLGNKVMSKLIGAITHQKFYDVSCGFRAYSRDALYRLNLFGAFTYTQESFLNCAFKNVPILEVPIKVRGQRKVGKSRVADNLFRYAYQTLKIIIRTVRDYKPFKMFFYISLVFFFLALALAVFLGVHYFSTGRFSPHKWAGFTSGFLFILSFLSLTLGFVLDMFARMRINQEEILYYLKKMNRNAGNDD